MDREAIELIRKIIIKKKGVRNTPTTMIIVKHEAKRELTRQQ